MNNSSHETSRTVTQNNQSLIGLTLIDDNDGDGDDGEFHSENSDDYSTLGTAIANNTHLDRLAVVLTNSLPLGVSDRGFYDGLKRNSSISNLQLWCFNLNIAGGVGQEILKAYQENNNHLIRLHIDRAGIQNGGDRVIGDTLRCCRNLQSVALTNCNITDEQLLTIVDAVRGHRMLEELYLNGNNIGNAGCEAIAALLTDPNCNLHTLYLGSNAINNEGATTIANTLINNNKLQHLYLGENQIDQSIEDIFSNILCNTTSINDIYSSNHTLETLSLVYRHQGQQLQSLLRLNEDTNKNHVAMRKILKFHPNIDMEPLFQWDSEGEQSLKALPYVIDWFERAEEAVADDRGSVNDEDSNSDNDDEEEEEQEVYQIEQKKLSAIFQFAKAMPLMFVPAAHIRVNDSTRKRKRGIV